MYDDNGQLLSGSMMDYHVPTAAATAAERTLAGSKGDAAAIDAAAAKATEGVKALSDLVASSEFRRHLLTVYAQRALARALEAARG